MQGDQDTAARRDPAERWNEAQRAGCLARSPVTIIACGCPPASDGQLVPLQAAVGRLIAWLTGLRLPRFGTPPAPAARILTNR
jgi:hypothetical protein